MEQIEKIIEKINRNQEFDIQQIPSNSQVYRLIKLDVNEDGGWKKKVPLKSGYFLGEYDNRAFMLSIESLKKYKKVAGRTYYTVNGDSRTEFHSELCDSFNNFFSLTLEAKVQEGHIQFSENTFTYTTEIKRDLPLDQNITYVFIEDLCVTRFVPCASHRLDGYGVPDPEGYSNEREETERFGIGNIVEVENGIITNEYSNIFRKVWCSSYSEIIPDLVKKLDVTGSVFYNEPPLPIMLQREKDHSHERGYAIADPEDWKEELIEAITHK